MARWIVRNSDGAWMVQGFGDPSLIHSQPAKYTEVDCPGEECPNPRTERYDAGSPTRRRAATTAERRAYDAVMVRDVELATKVIRALATATHKRLKAMMPTDPMTAAQWEASIRAEYDAL